MALGNKEAKKQRSKNDISNDTNSYHRGLGLEMSKALAESGADVALMYVSSDKTHDIAAKIGQDYGVICKAYKADIADAKQVQQAIDQIYKDFGAIDVFVANAGINSGGAARVKIIRKSQKGFF